MDTHKLKVKVGSHEFEAEGTQEAVEKQFDAFKDLVKMTGAGPAKKPDPATRTPDGHNKITDVDLKTIIKVDDDKASLTAHPAGQDPEGDAVLLLLLAHKTLLATEQVSGILLLAAMKESGFQIERVARIVAALPAGEVIRTGAKKGVKYRLTNSGVAHARQVANTLIATLT